jgi:hypothetical protein
MTNGQTKKFSLKSLIAIFAGALIVAVAVGAIIYTQTGEKFQGALTTGTRLSSTAELSAETLDTTKTITTTTTEVGTTSAVFCDPVLGLINENNSCVCNEAAGFVTSGNYETFTCTCKDGYTLSADKKTCTAPLKVITTTATPLATLATCTGVGQIETTDAAGAKTCKCDTANHFIEDTSVRALACICETGYNLVNGACVAITTTLTCPAERGLIVSDDGKTCVCDDPFIKNPATALVTQALNVPAQPCLCPDGSYYDLKGACTEIDCNTTEEMAATILKDPAKYWITSTTLAILNNFSEWKTENCMDDCTKLKTKLAEYITAKNYNAALAMLPELVTKKCITPCESTLYSIVFNMQTGLSAAEPFIEKYFDDKCGDCDMYYKFIVSIAASLSNQTNPDLNSFKKLLEKYVTTCQCLDLETFLTNPSYMPGETDTTSSLRTPINLSNPATSLSRLSSSIFPTAYAQAAAAPTDILSDSVKQAIEEVLEENCDKEEEPVCKTLTIVDPTSSSMWEISYDYEVDEDLVIDVDDKDAVAFYVFSSSEGTFKFDGDTTKTTNLLTVNITGGPNAGQSDVITVKAYDAKKQELKCTDTLTVTRKLPPPVQKTPKCNYLQIVAPEEADEEGQPTITISKEGYINETLGFIIDSDEGVVSGYRIRSENNTIKFDGQSSPYDIDADVYSVKMNGGPNEGEDDVISIWAMDKSGKGIDTCVDAFRVKVDKPVPPPETPPPTTTITQLPPVEVPQETVIPPVTTVVHEAAPTPIKVASSGPEMLIYFVGAGICGLVFRKKKK